MRTEFHVHTSVSKDSLLGKYALLMMCKVRRIGCLAITDHNEVRGAMDLRPFLRSHGVDVIVGEEVFSRDGEIIGLFLHERIPAGLSAEETVAQIQAQGGIVYIPHPYDRKREKTVITPEALKRISSQVDCIEIHNGRNSDESYSVIQKKICDEHGLAPIVGGDSHCFFEVGRNYCLTENPFSREDFSKVLSRAEFHVSTCLWLSHKMTKLVKAIKMLKRGDFDGLYRAINRRSR